MNQLIIIGNGFDLAHGLKTSYKDFILDLLSAEVSKPKGSKINKDEDLAAINNIYSYNINPVTFNTFKEYNKYIDKCGMIALYNPFFEKTLEYCEKNNWVDIEKLYYRELQKIIQRAININSFKLDQSYIDDVKFLIELWTVFIKKHRKNLTRISKKVLEKTKDCFSMKTQNYTPLHFKERSLS